MQLIGKINIEIYKCIAEDITTDEVIITDERIQHIKAIPHKGRLKPLPHSCLHIFRHIAPKFLDIRKYACEILVQSDEKSDCASVRQPLCGIALTADTPAIMMR